MQRVVVLGRGGAGKSTFSRGLGAALSLPVVELDKHFWQEGLRPLSVEHWHAVQGTLVAAESWVMDGDLGPYDALEVRLERADTVVLLDYPLLLCAWRAVRRGREARGFWVWVWQYRRHHLPAVLAAVEQRAPKAALLVLRSPRAASDLLDSLRGM